ncbi:unnamed protein product [Rotaria sordida]|uniref:Uncharacterized protein n=2 Tax=Rotaria sordida TaxID=392033 RepID=A0A815PLZ2_9BILA|nr:unnamed protein product [Rotaria sordida]
MSTDENSSSSDNNKSHHFARNRWYQVLDLAEQLRHKTEIQKNEHLLQYAFDIPSSNDRQTSLNHADNVKSFENALLFAKTGNFNLDNLSENFLDLKRTFNHMIKLNKNDLTQITLSTSITKTALLMILRSIESIVEVMTNHTRKFPTLNSLISYIRSRQNELPIQGKLLVEWYKVAQVLDLLTNDPDWLVQPQKAYWAINICNETLIWARGVFNKNYRTKSSQRPIFDREDSITTLQSEDKE